MNQEGLIATVKRLMGDHKGLLAMDESTSTCNKRLAEVGIAQTKEARYTYRDWIIATPGLSEGISGVILCDETLGQSQNGRSFIEAVKGVGIIPGIKVDGGAVDMVAHPGEKITEGVESLQERLANYVQMGARFAKWRAVIVMGAGIPSQNCIEANAKILARYALLCQEAGLVPIVEPEVIIDDEATLDRSFNVTQAILRTVFKHLYASQAILEGMILKPNMVLAGSRSSHQPTIEEVAIATVNCLLQSVPSNVGGVAFLSGGQEPELASARLNEMKKKFKSQLPWPLTFSFARAIQQPALKIWQGNPAHVSAAQQVLYHRVLCNRAACLGEYSSLMEKEI